jgi:hypothetical protein
MCAFCVYQSVVFLRRDWVRSDVRALRREVARSEMKALYQPNFWGRDVTREEAREMLRDEEKKLLFWSRLSPVHILLGTEAHNE